MGRRIAIVASGPNAGKELVLTKALTTLGRPGDQVAAITRRSDAETFQPSGPARAWVYYCVPPGAMPSGGWNSIRST